MLRVRTAIWLSALVAVLCLTWKLSAAQVLLDEQFSTDVIGSGSWIASDASVSVDVAHGWLHIGSGGTSDDGAEKYGSFPLPLVIEWRCTHVSGEDTSLPKLELFWGASNSESYHITYVPNSSDGWLFGAWTGVHTLGTTSANEWRTVKAIIRSDGGELFAKRDSDPNFTPITTETWTIPNEIVRFRLSQHSDAVSDFDYVRVTTFQPQGWCDDFETYSASTSWSTNWHGSANVVGISIDSTSSHTPSKSLRLFGIVSWPAIVTRPIPINLPVEVSAYVKNGSGPLSGPDVFRAMIGIRGGGPNWYDNPFLHLLAFDPNGDIRFGDWANPSIRSGYSLDTWYNVRCNLSSPESGLLREQFWVDNQFIGEFIVPFNWINGNVYLDISSQADSVWFDDVCIDTGRLASILMFPSVSLAPCDSGIALQPVMADLSKPAKGGAVTLKVPNGVTYKGISTAGLSTASWDVIGYPHLDSGYIIVRLNNTSGLRLPADTTTLFNIQFMAPRQCLQANYIHWDTAQSANPSSKTAFTDTLYATFYPEFDGNGDSSEMQGFKRGDVDNSGEVDISDLSALIDYLYISFTKPCLLSAVDVTHDGFRDISDLTMMIDYLYISFTALQCPLSAVARPTVAQINNEFSVFSLLADGKTVISLEALREVKGIQFELSGSVGAQPINLISDGIKLYSGWKDGVLRVGMVDPTGKESIPSGKTRLLTLNGEYKILSATLADAEHRSITPGIGSAASVTLPIEYALSQNYPNPFNPATTISFAMPQAGYAKLEIYNTLGQLVATLVDEELEAGTHAVTWDASVQASGLYLYRLTTSDFVETKKMLLLK